MLASSLEIDASSVSASPELMNATKRHAGLLPSYSIALYLHRFLENSLAPAFAERVLSVSAWSQIIVGGSNFGEVSIALCSSAEVH